MAGMGFGTCICVTGVMADLLFSAVGETSDKEPADQTPAEKVAAEQAAAELKCVACIAGTTFNLGAALATPSQPGCWTQTSVVLKSQTIANVGGAAAVVASHYFVGVPQGSYVIVGAMTADTALTLCSVFSGE